MSEYKQTKSLLSNEERRELIKQQVAEIERLRAENWQLKQACGYPIPADKETINNPFKCGTCDAKSIELDKLRAERQAFTDELYELRNRAGCGPKQAGLDIWQQNAELLALLDDARICFKNRDRSGHEDVVYAAICAVMRQWLTTDENAEEASFMARAAIAKVSK